MYYMNETRSPNRPIHLSIHPSISSHVSDWRRPNRTARMSERANKSFACRIFWHPSHSPSGHPSIASRNCSIRRVHTPVCCVNTRPTNRSIDQCRHGNGNGDRDARSMHACTGSGLIDALAVACGLCEERASSGCVSLGDRCAARTRKPAALFCDSSFSSLAHNRWVSPASVYSI